MSKIIIYKYADNQTQVEVPFEGDTFWLNQYPLAQVRQEGKRKVKRAVLHYNLDAIHSVGYRVNAIPGTQFRQWATQRVKAYLVKNETAA